MTADTNQLPITRDLKRFTMSNREDNTLASEDVPGFGRQHQSEEIIVNKDPECRPSINTGKKILQVSESKEQDKRRKKVSKRKRLTWTDDLQMKFLAAVESAGIEAPLRKICQLMNVPGLTRQNLSNHLQKYRQSIKNEQNQNGSSCDLNSGSHHLCQIDNDQGKFPLFKQGAPYNQMYICNCMPEQNLRTPHYFASPEIPNDNGEASADTSQVENTTNGKPFREDPFLYCVDSAAGQNEMDFLTLLSDANAHWIFADEAGNIVESFYTSKFTPQSSPEDLIIWLS